MAQEHPEGAIEAQDLKVFWDHHAPTFVSDGPIGTAWAGDLHRITMGEIILNPDPSSEQPAARPSVNLVMSKGAIRTLIAYLQQLPGITSDE